MLQPGQVHANCPAIAHFDAMLRAFPIPTPRLHVVSEPLENEHTFHAPGNIARDAFALRQSAPFLIAAWDGVHLGMLLQQAQAGKRAKRAEHEW